MPTTIIVQDLPLVMEQKAEAMVEQKAEANLSAGDVNIEM